MRYLLLILPILFLSACVSFRWITVENGQIVNENRRPSNVVGNPTMACYDSYNNLIAEGYFVVQNTDNSFIIDEFGKDYVNVTNPRCRIDYKN